MIVVSDTSALTNLLAIRREWLLERLFGTVVIPPAVHEELRAAHSLLPAFLEIRNVRDSSKVAVLLDERLDPGEAEAIVMAEEIGADYLLIDESAGRAVAVRRGLDIMGLLGVLGRAKRNGLIAAVRPEIEALEATAGFWISEKLREQILSDMNEA